jgi:hypothetical protein
MRLEGEQDFSFVRLTWIGTLEDYLRGGLWLGTGEA